MKRCMKRKYADTIDEIDEQEKENNDDSKEQPTKSVLFHRPLSCKQLLDLFCDSTPLVRPLIAIVYSYYLSRIHVASADNGNFALVDGTVFAWGSNNKGQLGTGDTTNHLSPTPILFPERCKVKQIAANSSHSLLLAEDDRLFAWGVNDVGQLGMGDGVYRHDNPTLVSLPKQEKAKRIAAGFDCSFVLTKNEILFVWGNNSNGQLGTGDRTRRLIPTPVLLPDGQKVRRIAAGDDHTVVSTENGTLLAWGANYNGQLGTGDTTERLRPTRIFLSNGHKAKQVAAGSYTTFVITENGELFAWGGNGYGQLGMNDTHGRSMPTYVVLPKGQKAKRIAAGCYHTSLVTENGTLLAWGSNDRGQLGTGDTTHRLCPTAVALPEGQKAKRTAVGYYHTLVSTENGMLLSCGADDDGQLGATRYHQTSFIVRYEHMSYGTTTYVVI